MYLHGPNTLPLTRPTSTEALFFQPPFIHTARLAFSFRLIINHTFSNTGCGTGLLQQRLRQVVHSQLGMPPTGMRPA